MNNNEGNNEKKKGIRTLVNLWPAALAGVMVASMIPQTRPVLQEIPELLSVDVLGETNTSADTESEKETTLTHPEKKKETTTTRKKAAAGVGDYTDGEYEGSAQGYGGIVKVRVTVKNKQIVSVDILEASGETAAFFSKAQAVIDDVITAQTWEVDVISGATYSSRGILGAIQNALTGAAVVNEAAPSASGAAGTLTQTAFTVPEGGYADGTYTGSATGFGGPITVSVTVSGGKITGISILSASGETSSYLSAATGVISRMLSAQSPNVDTVSGATYSSTGIINAVKAALSGAGNSSAAAVSSGGLSDNSSSKKGSSSQTVDVSTIEAKPAQQLKDGTYTGTGDGFGGDVVVKMTVSEGKISSIEIVSAEDETTSFLTRAEGVISKILSAQSADVDVVSGATYSSNGIIEAVKEALGQAEAAQKEENQSEDADDDKESGTAGDKKSDADDDKESGTAGDKKSDADDDKESGTAGDKKSDADGDKESGTADGEKTDTGDDSDEKNTDEPEQPATRFIDGTYTSVVLCTDDDTFNYQVQVTIVIENDRITSVTAERIEDMSDDPDSNARYFDYALNGRTRKNVWYEGIVNQIISSQSADAVDAVSGATYSSAAITEASGIALSEAENLMNGESMEG